MDSRQTRPPARDHAAASGLMRRAGMWIGLTLSAATPVALAERALGFAPDEIPSTGALVVPVSRGALAGPALAIDRQSGGALGRAVLGALFEGEPAEVLTLTAFAGYERLGLVGIGDGAVDRNGLRDFGGAAAQLSAQWPDSSVVITWAERPEGVEHPTAHIAFGAALGQYRFDKFKSEPAKTGQGALKILARDPAAAQAEYAGEWAPVAAAVRFARDLVNEPANAIYPESFVARARAAFEGLPKVEFNVLGVEEMKARNMGALLGVGQGSRRLPRLLVVRYRGADAPPVVFAGKGITFDTGGISLKNPTEMWRMKYDMSGAAAVTAAVLALAGRGAPVHAVAVAALAENMPSATAQRPGDVIRAMSGKTIEIHSTDAEGRLVLADAVWFAQAELSPALLVDVATLTGSVRVALGDEYGGLFTRADETARRLLAAAERAGEALWRLPLDPSYPKDIESDIADVKNVSGHRLAGAGIGAQFIGEFVEQSTPWAHLDIAGVAWRDEDTPTTPKGATGFGVRLLDQLVRDFYQQ